MKNTQKGSATVISLVIIIVILLGFIGYFYIRPVQTLRVQNVKVDNQQIVNKEDTVKSSVINQIKETPVTKIVTPAYDLMKDTLSKLGVSEVNLTNYIFDWNTSKGKVSYSGYSFVVNHTPAENLQIAQTWKNTGSLDKLDIRSRFVNELKANGFVEDWNNIGDGTFVGSSGYVKNNIVCLIKDKITTPLEQVNNTSGVSSINTIICADKK
jgi:hypothetical protein